MTSLSQSSSEPPDPSSILYEPPRVLETQRQPFKPAWKDSFLLTQYIRMIWKRTTIEKLQSGTTLSHHPTTISTLRADPSLRASTSEMKRICRKKAVLAVSLFQHPENDVPRLLAGTEHSSRISARETVYFLRLSD